MGESLLRQQVKVRQGACLPHWTKDGSTYHVVFRLADSLPAQVVARFRTEREALRAEAVRDGLDAMVLEARLQALFSDKIEAVLDQGRGACWLAREPVAMLVIKALRHFNEQRYTLRAWCIMPNHVHVVVQPKPGHGLPAILKSWKGFTALQSNRCRKRDGVFWQPEYYDHLIRHETELSRTHAIGGHHVSSEATGKTTHQIHERNTFRKNHEPFRTSLFSATIPSRVLS